MSGGDDLFWRTLTVFLFNQNEPMMHGKLKARQWKVTRTSKTEKSVSLRISTGEELGILANISGAALLNHLTIHQEILKPGRRSSPPHYHSIKEEIVYVIRGNPSVYINGKLKKLKPGEFVGFPASVAFYHMIINESDHDAVLLVISANHDDDIVSFEEEQLQLF